MATTENTITGNTTTGPHSFTFPYIKADDVKASKNGSTLTKVTSFSSDAEVKKTQYTQATTSITLGEALLTDDKPQNNKTKTGKHVKQRKIHVMKQYAKRLLKNNNNQKQ